jgi:hypothetical protein
MRVPILRHVQLGLLVVDITEQTSIGPIHNSARLPVHLMLPPHRGQTQPRHETHMRRVRVAAECVHITFVSKGAMHSTTYCRVQVVHGRLLVLVRHRLHELSSTLPHTCRRAVHTRVCATCAFFIVRSRRAWPVREAVAHTGHHMTVI